MGERSDLIQISCGNHCEVIVYEHPDFTGLYASFKLDPTWMRQKLVADAPAYNWNGISSFQVGSKVGVCVFKQTDWRGNYATKGWGVYLGSVRDLSEHGINDDVRSLIVFPKGEEQVPLGVFLRYSLAFEGDFFPLPESLYETESPNAKLNSYLDNESDSVHLTSKYVGVTLYDGENFTGESITFPGAEGMGMNEYLLNKYGGWDEKAPSLKVRWIGPPPPPRPTWGGGGVKVIGATKISGKWDSNLGNAGMTGTKVTGKGISIEIIQNGKEFTWSFKGLKHPGTVEGTDVTTGSWLKGKVTQIEPSGIATRIEWDNGFVFFREAPSGVAGAKPAGGPPAPPAGPQSGLDNISGKWDSSIGHVYEITQNGNQLTWFAASINQQGAGTVSGKGVSASWQDPGGAGSAKGNITEVDPSGVATRIEWDNGVVFFRKAPPPAGGAPAPPGQQTPGPPGWNLEDMTDRPGMDYKVFWLNGGVDECMKACETDPNCRAFTYFGPGVQGPQARCYLKSGVPSPVKNQSLSGVRPSQPPPSQLAPSKQATAPPVTSKTPDITGKWNSTIGVEYVIIQIENNFTWTVAKLGQSGSGTLAGKTITASWSDAGGSGSAKGTVTEVDANGRAIRIEWDNGVVFFR